MFFLDVTLLSKIPINLVVLDPLSSSLTNSFLIKMWGVQHKLLQIYKPEFLIFKIFLSNQSPEEILNVLFRLARKFVKFLNRVWLFVFVKTMWWVSQEITLKTNNSRPNIVFWNWELTKLNDVVAKVCNTLQMCNVLIMLLPSAR